MPFLPMAEAKLSKLGWNTLKAYKNENDSSWKSVFVP